MNCVERTMPSVLNCFKTAVTSKWNYRRYCRPTSKLSYVHKVGQEPLRALTIGNLLESTANKFPETHAIISRKQNVRLTYQGLLKQANALAAGFLRIGFEKGDCLGLWAPNMLEWIVVQMATARAGLILVPINPFYTAPEIRYCINKVGLKGIICPDSIKDVHFYSILNEVSRNIEKSEPGKLKCDRVPSLKTIITLSDRSLKGAYNYNEVQEMAESTLVKSVETNQRSIQPDDIATIYFSSGTTGKPKATKLTHYSMINNSFYVGKRGELDQMQHTACIQLPFFHAFGSAIVLLSLISFGAVAVIPSPFYNPVENINAIKEETCTVIYGTPTMYVDLVNVQTKFKLDINPEFAVCGGSTCSPILFKKMKELLKVKKVKSVYGLTETLIAFHSLPVQEDEYMATETVGHIGDHIEAKVVDPNGSIVPIGTPGELCIRGYSNMLGYWSDDENTRRTIGADGWLKTGDQFVLQEDGYGRIVGRLKDMIIRGGENIFPKEVEDFLNTHPNILECYVIGLPNDRLGEEVCACARLVDGSKLTLEAINEFCTGKLAKFKIPTILKIVDDFPRTRSGKIQKFRLRDEFSQK